MYQKNGQYQETLTTSGTQLTLPVSSKNWYRILGVGLGLGGLGLAPLAHFILQSTASVALGIAMIILGAICLVLERACQRVPPGMSLILMESSLENVSAMLEELGLTARAIYLPSSLTGGKPRALIPLNSNGVPPKVSRPMPRRLIVRYGPGPEDMGLLVSTPGSAAVGMLESKPGATDEEIGIALNSLLVGALDVADGVTVFAEDGKITVEISGSYMAFRNTRLNHCLGSTLASIVASVASEALDRPLVIEQDQLNGKGKGFVELDVLYEND